MVLTVRLQKSFFTTYLGKKEKKNGFYTWVGPPVPGLDLLSVSGFCHYVSLR